MPHGSDEPFDPRPQTVAALREVAARRRRLAGEIFDQQAEAMLVAFAVEMEARAAARDRSAQNVSRSDAVAVQRSNPDEG